MREVSVGTTWAAVKTVTVVGDFDFVGGAVVNCCGNVRFETIAVSFTRFESHDFGSPIDTRHSDPIIADSGDGPGYVRPVAVVVHWVVIWRSRDEVEPVKIVYISVFVIIEGWQ